MHAKPMYFSWPICIAKQPSCKPSKTGRNLHRAQPISGNFQNKNIPKYQTSRPQEISDIGSALIGRRTKNLNKLLLIFAL